MQGRSDTFFYKQNNKLRLETKAGIMYTIKVLFGVSTRAYIFVKITFFFDKLKKDQSYAAMLYATL